MEETSHTGEAGSPEKQEGLSASQRAALRQLITALLKIAKDIGFYPGNSPVIAQSLDRVTSVLHEVSEIADPVVFEVQQDQFLARGNRLLDDLGAEQRFAARLFGLGVRAMELHSGTTSQEIHQFLNVIRDAHRGNMDFDSLTERLTQAGVSGIVLYPAARLDASRLVDGQAPVTRETAVGAAIEEDKNRVGRMLGEFTRRLGASEQDAQLVLDYLRETNCLVAAADELGTLPADEAPPPLFEQLFGSIVEAARRAQRSRPSLRKQLLNELSKAVDTMDDDLRKTFVREQLIAQAGPNTGEAALLSRLSHEILADELADDIVLHGGTEAAVHAYFLNMPVSAEGRDDIIELARKRVAERADNSELAKNVLRGLDLSGSSAGGKGGAGRKDDVSSTIEASDLAALALAHEQRAEMERVAHTALDDVDQHNAWTLLVLLNMEQDPALVEKMVARLETLRMKLLCMPAGFGAVTEIVEGYLSKRKACAVTGESEQALRVTEAINQAIKAACSDESLMMLLDLTVRCDKSSRHYKAIVDYFNLIGAPAYQVLVDTLRSESVRSRRMAARMLVVSIGDPCIELLTGNIANEQWYVIRNIALILGDMRSDKGIVYLSQALKHADRRVRHEAVNGLGKIGSPQAARTLMTVLSNDDLDTVHAAVRWLGLLGSADAVKDLVRLMDTLGNSSAQRQLKLSIVDALMQIGSPLALASLERVQRARKWFFFKRDSVLAEAAAHAAATIRERIDAETE